MLHEFSRLDVLRLAAAVPCDPRTARKALRDLDSLSPLMRERVARALAELGHVQEPEHAEKGGRRGAA